MGEVFQRRRRLLGIVLLALVAVSLFLVAYPLYVIRPFRHQGARELALALSVSRIRDTSTAAIAIASALALAAYWSAQANRWKRALASAGTILAVGLAFLGRVNVYEQLMFHPNPNPSFSPVLSARLDPDEKVIAIAVNGERRAYPIRSMSYHHVLNDVVGSEPVVSTY